MLPLPIEDRLEGARDAVLLKHGVRLEDEPHFFSDALLRKPDLLKDKICELCCDSEGISYDRLRPDQIISRAMLTSHFAEIMTQAGQIAARTRLNAAARDIRQMCSIVEMRNYLPSNFPLVETDQITNPQPGLGGPATIPLLWVTGGGETIQVDESVRLVMFSRQMLINDDHGVILRSTEAIAAGAGRTLGKKFATTLEANATMADGVTLFDSSQGNDLTSGGLDVAALNASADALRNVPTPDGDLSNGKPRFLLVPSSHEMSARLLAASFNDGQAEEDWIRVVALPWLGSTYSYLLPDPAEAPAIAMAVIEGSDILKIEQVPKPVYSELATDAWGYRVRVAVGVAPVSHSIVRNTLA